MEYQVITTIEEFASLKTAWEKIEKSDPDIMFFSTFEYRYTWWEIYQNHPNYNLWIVCVKHNNEIVGIAPFIRKKTQKRFLSYTSLMFLGDGDYKDFLILNNPEIKVESVYKVIFETISSYEHLWDEIRLTHISQKSSLALFLLKSEYNGDFKYLIENPYISFKDFKDFKDFSSKQIPKKTNQYSNRLKRETNYSFHITNKNLIDEFSKIHIAEKNHLHSYGKTHRSSLFENSFSYKFIDSLFSKGLYTSYYLYDNISKEIMIFNYGFSYNNVFNSITTAFNPSYSHLGVGKILYYEIFKNNFLNPIWDIFDTGTGRYPWKFEWATGFNFLYQLHIVNPKAKKMKMFYKYKKWKHSLTNS
jgi:hypothetical protein